MLLCLHSATFAELLQRWLKAAGFDVRRGEPRRMPPADVVLLQPDDRRADVFRLAHELRSRGSAVLFIGPPPLWGWIHRALLAGASGYLSDAAELSDIARAIGAVREGHCYFSPCASCIVAEMAARSARESPRFSAREIQVLRLMCKGLSAKETARGLDLQVKSVDAIRARLMEKTGTSRAPDLVRYACQEGLVDPVRTRAATSGRAAATRRASAAPPPPLPSRT